jgi:L-asparaginase/Glu-tRNA(Gln) amidotransferase subunit D
MGKTISKDLDRVEVGDLIITAPGYPACPDSQYRGVVLGIGTKGVVIHWFGMGETHLKNLKDIHDAIQRGAWVRYEGRRSTNL